MRSLRQFLGGLALLCAGVVMLAAQPAPVQLLLWQHPSGGVVQVDAIASAAVQCASGTSCNFTNETISGGLSNSALVVTITQTTSTNLSGMTVTWDSGGSNQSMTQICQFNTVNGQTWLFGLLNPTAGNKTLALSWTTTGQIFVDSVSLKGVIQANIATAFQHSNSATGSSVTPTVAVTSQANDLVISDWAALGNFSGAYSGTEIYHSNGGVVWNAAASYDSGAGSVTATATITSAQWLGCSIDVVHS